MTPPQIATALSQPPHTYLIDDSTIVRWAKAGDWQSYKIALSQMPQEIIPDPSEYPLYHLATLEAEKASNQSQDVTDILQTVNMALRPGQPILQWLKDVYLPHYLATGERYDPMEGYEEIYGLVHQPLPSNQVAFDFAMIPAMEESLELEMEESIEPENDEIAQIEQRLEADRLNSQPSLEEQYQELKAEIEELKEVIEKLRGESEET